MKRKRLAHKRKQLTHKRKRFSKTMRGQYMGPLLCVRLYFSLSLSACVEGCCVSFSVWLFVSVKCLCVRLSVSVFSLPNPSSQPRASAHIKSVCCRMKMGDDVCLGRKCWWWNLKILIYCFLPDWYKSSTGIFVRSLPKCILIRCQRVNLAVFRHNNVTLESVKLDV